MKLELLLAATGIAAVIAAAAPAHADDQAFLDDVARAGVMLGGTPAGELQVGRMTCDNLHHGMSPDAAAGQFGMVSGTWGPAIVSAAQRDLCPDTLH